MNHSKSFSPQVFVLILQKEFKVSERYITMKEVIQARTEGRVSLCPFVLTLLHQLISYSRINRSLSQFKINPFLKVCV